MISLKTIDVAIGVAFLYLLITFAAAALVEILSTARNWRAKMLHDAIANMLNNSSLADVEEIYNNPLVLALCRNEAAPSRVDLLERFGWRAAHGGTPPSYIPAVTFSGAVLEALMNRAESEFKLSPEGTVDLIRGLLNAQVHTSHTKCACCAKACTEDALQSVLRTTLATQGASIQAVRFAIEKWFNDTMDRASGWYKRRTQSCLLLIGLAIAFGGNISTIAVAGWLWRSDAARQAVITAAADRVAKGPQSATQPSGGTQPSSGSLGSVASEIVNLDQQIVGLQYPIGWKAAYLRADWTLWLPEYVFGGLLTAIAISMGSSFWFDAVQNLIRVRGAGPKPSSR
jgi:hypothetical protein